MSIILTILGVVLVAMSDRLQVNNNRKPKLNIYMSALGGILWLIGIILCFFTYSLPNAALILFGSFVLAAIIGVRR